MAWRSATPYRKFPDIHRSDAGLRYKAMNIKTKIISNGGIL